jgi:hypothetical protein
MQVVKSLHIALLTLLAAATMAEAKGLDCTFTPSSATQGWIADRSVFDWDEAAGTARVMDGIINYFHEKKPMDAKVRVVSAAQTAFSWTLRTKDAGGQYAQMQYRATFFPADNTMIVTSKPDDFVNQYEARGTCKVS